MTQEQFIELQKEVYVGKSKEWERLINAWNQRNKMKLNPQLRTTYIVILSAIAKKNNLQFHPTDLHKYSPVTNYFDALQRNTDVQRTSKS